MASESQVLKEYGDGGGVMACGVASTLENYNSEN